MLGQQAERTQVCRMVVLGRHQQDDQVDREAVEAIEGDAVRAESHGGDDLADRVMFGMRNRDAAADRGRTGRLAFQDGGQDVVPLDRRNRPGVRQAIHQRLDGGFFVDGIQFRHDGVGDDKVKLGRQRPEIDGRPEGLRGVRRAWIRKGTGRDGHGCSLGEMGMVQSLTRATGSADPRRGTISEEILENLPEILGPDSGGVRVRAYVVAISRSGRRNVAEKPDPWDQEIRRLLAGTKAEIDEALARISDRYTWPICGGIRRHFRWFPAEDLADAWQSTLLVVFEKALAKKLDTAQPIARFLWIVMKRRCCDILNKDARCRKGLQALGETLRNEVKPDETQTEDWAELFHLVDKALIDLPTVQQMVWVAYRDLGFSATDEQLLERLRETTKPRKPWTKTSVRRGKEEGRKKLRRILKKRGYVWSVPTNPSSRWA